MTGWGAYIHFRDDFAQVLDTRRYNLDWLDRAVSVGQIWCIATDDAAIIYSLRYYPTGVFDLDGLAATGKVDSVVQTLIPSAAEHGRSIGALGFIVESRPAWKRLLADQGFEPFQTCLRKDL